MKQIRLTKHAVDQCAERGATEEEVIEAIQKGLREPTKHGRFIFRSNFQYNDMWHGEMYAIKQVAPVVVDEKDEIIVVTVYTFFF